MGVSRDKLRFRQHLSHEMAHYATDCWDAECKTSYVSIYLAMMCNVHMHPPQGWVECVGCADRSCFDLTQHSKASEAFNARKDLAHPDSTDAGQREGEREDVVIPSVVEPSFGIGRILYTILEHSFSVREEDAKRVWLALPPMIAPISCSVLLLSANKQFEPFKGKLGRLNSQICVSFSPNKYSQLSL